MIETKLISNGSTFSKEDGDTSLLIKSEDFAMIMIVEEQFQKK